jgi:hypothetical protein
VTTRAALLALALIAAACSGSGDNPLGPSLNRAPVIRSVNVSPAQVQLGGTARVQVDASDPDGDRLFYRYTANAGTVTPDATNPALAIYTQNGSDQPTDRIMVSVVDQHNAIDSASRVIRLQGNRLPDVAVSGGGSCHPDCAVTFTATANDEDNDDLAFEWSGCAEGNDRSVACRITNVGTVSATVVVSDGRGGVATDTGEASGYNSTPTVRGGEDFNLRQARFQVYYDDPDGDKLTCGWIGDCSCTGSVQSYNLLCSLPAGQSSCSERFACTDRFGASAETTFRLVP